MNDVIMNNMKAYQNLQGKQQTFLDECVWKYLLLKISMTPQFFSIYTKTESKLSRRTHWDLKRESVSHVCNTEIVSTSDPNGFMLLRSIIGFSMGIGIRCKPPNVSEQTRSLNRHDDIIIYVGDVGNAISFSYCHDLSILVMKISYSRGSMSNVHVRNHVDSLRSYYVNRDRQI